MNNAAKVLWPVACGLLAGAGLGWAELYGRSQEPVHGEQRSGVLSRVAPRDDSHAAAMPLKDEAGFSTRSAAASAGSGSPHEAHGQVCAAHAIHRDVEHALETAKLQGSTREFLAAQGVQRLSEWKRGAGDGCPLAQWLLGCSAEQGIGQKKDLQEAFKYYQQAGQGGFGPALNDLGLCYLYGRGVAPDYELARKYFEEAYHMGRASAAYNIGTMHEKGLGSAKNLAKSREWFLKAAGMGYGPAQRALQ